MPFDILNRPRRKDRQGIVHVAYSWSATFFEPMCECYTVRASRESDEPDGTVFTCLLCWNMVINKGTRAEGEVDP